MKGKVAYIEFRSRKGEPPKGHKQQLYFFQFGSGFDLVATKLKSGSGLIAHGRIIRTSFKSDTCGSSIKLYQYEKKLVILNF